MPWQIVHRWSLFWVFVFFFYPKFFSLGGATPKNKTRKRGAQTQVHVYDVCRSFKRLRKWRKHCTRLAQTQRSDSAPGSVWSDAIYLRRQPRILGVQRGRRPARTAWTLPRKERNCQKVVFIPLCPVRVLRRFLLSWAERKSILLVKSDFESDEDDDS